MIKSKVFCIGFHKTGTTSLKFALKALGYRVTGPNGVNDPDISRNVYRMACEIAEQFDAFQDNPWPLLYREIDQRYPGSRFILTLRPTEDWIKSQISHFRDKTTPMRKWIYGAGCPLGNEEIYVARYERHNKDVLSYFNNRPGDFLVLTLGSGGEWRKLCEFLNAPIPDAPFPHANSSARRRKQQYML